MRVRICTSVCVYSHTHLSIGDVGELLFVSKYTITYTYTQQYAFLYGENNTSSSCNKITCKSICTLIHSSIHPHTNTCTDTRANNKANEWYCSFSYRYVVVKRKYVSFILNMSILFSFFFLLTRH